MNRKRILLIEDCQFSRNHIEEALNIFPEITIIVKETAEKALSYVDENPDLDLMLIDIGLPKMNGMEFLERINLDYKNYKSIPKLAITAHVMTTEMDSYIGKGFLSVISKPVKLNVLRSTIKKYLKIEGKEGI